MSGPRGARGQFEAIAAFRAAAVARGVAAGSGVALGIGDDAAVLAPPPGHDLVFTTDLLVEERHFVLAPRAGHVVAAPRQVGWKALAVSVSDTAAMGARALWAVLSLALPEERVGEFADELVAGLLDCAAEYGVALVGGDTVASPGPVAVNVALLGAVPHGRALRRDGARPGDAVCVTGALGGSLLGRHLRPIPRQAAALSLVQRGVAHALVDLSDGLSSDLGHVLDASAVGAVLWAGRVPLHADAHRAAAADGRSALDHALHDGEDFELCFCAPRDAAAALVREGLAGVAVAEVGVVTAAPGLVLAEHEGSGDGVPLARGGHDHFRAR